MGRRVGKIWKEAFAIYPSLFGVRKMIAKEGLYQMLTHSILGYGAGSRTEEQQRENTCGRGLAYIEGTVSAAPGCPLIAGLLAPTPRRPLGEL